MPVGEYITGLFAPLMDTLSDPKKTMQFVGNVAAGFAGAAGNDPNRVNELQALRQADENRKAIAGVAKSLGIASPEQGFPEGTTIPDLVNFKKLMNPAPKVYNVHGVGLVRVDEYGNPTKLPGSAPAEKPLTLQQREGDTYSGLPRATQERIVTAPAEQKLAGAGLSDERRTDLRATRPGRIEALGTLSDQRESSASFLAFRKYRGETLLPQEEDELAAVAELKRQQADAQAARAADTRAMTPEKLKALGALTHEREQAAALLAFKKERGETLLPQEEAELAAVAQLKTAQAASTEAQIAPRVEVLEAQRDLLKGKNLTEGRRQTLLGLQAATEAEKPDLARAKQKLINNEALTQVEQAALVRARTATETARPAFVEAQTALLNKRELTEEQRAMLLQGQAKTEAAKPALVRAQTSLVLKRELTEEERAALIDAQEDWYKARTQAERDKPLPVKGPVEQRAGELFYAAQGRLPKTAEERAPYLQIAREDLTRAHKDQAVSEAAAKALRAGRIRDMLKDRRPVSDDKTGVWLNPKTIRPVQEKTPIGKARARGAVRLTQQDFSILRRLQTAKPAIERLRKSPEILKLLMASTGSAIPDLLLRWGQGIQLKGLGTREAQDLQNLQALVQIEMAGPITGLNRIPIAELHVLSQVLNISGQTREGATASLNTAAEMIDHIIGITVGRDLPASVTPADWDALKQEMEQ